MRSTAALDAAFSPDAAWSRDQLIEVCRRMHIGYRTAREVLWALASHADETGRAWPAQERLAELVDCPRRDVRKALEALTEVGAIVREGTRDRSHVYRITGGVSPPLRDMAGTPPNDQDMAGTPRHAAHDDLAGNLAGDLAGNSAGTPRPEGKGREEGARARPRPTCPTHPNGTPDPCRACADARRAHDAWSPPLPPAVHELRTAPRCDHGEVQGRCPLCRRAHQPGLMQAVGQR